jgi:hypothetical protein
MSLPFVGDLITAGTDLIKSYFPPGMSEGQRAEAEGKLILMQAQLQGQAMDFQAKMEEELSNRHKSDMASDSWLSKNIRPLVLVYLMIAWTTFAGFSLFAFEVSPEYLVMLKQMLMAAFGFYFVSRGLEKITGIMSQGKK